MCEVAGVARSSVYAQRQAAKVTVREWHGPKTPWSDAEFVERVRAVPAEPPFVGKGHRKVRARLRFAGIRTCKDRVLKLMCEHGLQAPRRSCGPRGPSIHAGTIIPEALDLLWGDGSDDDDARGGPGNGAACRRPPHHGDLSCVRRKAMAP